jgi:hypothetical protein
MRDGRTRITLRSIRPASVPAGLVQVSSRAHPGREEDPLRQLFVGECFFCGQSSSDLDVNPPKLERSTDVVDNPFLFRLT